MTAVSMGSASRMALFVFSLVVLGCGGASPPPAERDPLADVAWIAGTWTGTGPDGAPAEEVWEAPASGVMRGRGAGETLRIEARDGGIVYVALPEGAAETAFRAVIVEEGRVVFENGEHDFPQRIEYARQADGTLRATISDLAGTQAMTWTFARTAAAAQP